MTNTQLVTVGGKQIALSDDSFKHVLSPSFNLLGIRRFIAVKFGFCTTVDEKGKLTYGEIEKMPFKDLKAALIAQGKATAEQLKEASAEYDSGRSAFYGASTQMAALIGADASLQKTVRPVFGKKGHIGFTVQARYAKATGKDARIAELEGQLAKLRLALPAAA